MESNTFFSTFGSFAAIGTLIIAVIAAVISIYRWSRRLYCEKNPYRAEYSIGTYVELTTDEQIINGTALKDTKGYVRTDTSATLEQKRKYSLFLDLIPRISGDIHSIEARFKPENRYQPTITHFQDLNPQSQGSHKPSAQRAGGMGLYYYPPLHTNERGKAIDYLINFETSENWKGKLCIRLEVVGRPVSLITIGINVK